MSPCPVEQLPTRGDVRNVTGESIYGGLLVLLCCLENRGFSTVDVFAILSASSLQWAHLRRSLVCACVRVFQLTRARVSNSGLVVSN